MIAAVFLAAAGSWIPVGTSDSRLSIFIDGDSVVDVAGVRRARVRIGSPQRIAGPIVLVYQDEEIDCAANSWRLTGYDARDENDRVVKRSGPSYRGGPKLAGVAGTIGGAVVASVCALPPAPRARK